MSELFCCNRNKIFPGQHMPSCQKSGATKIGEAKIISPQENKDETNAPRKNSRIQSLFYRCQVPEHEFAFLSKRRICASIIERASKNRKPVCYNVSVGGNSAAALFDIARN